MNPLQTIDLALLHQAELLSDARRARLVPAREPRWHRLAGALRRIVASGARHATLGRPIRS